MTTAIVAEFLLGTYTGHRSDGSPDPLPSPLRLHAALLNAAGQGMTAVEGRNGLEPSPEARAALDWLEANPPTGLLLPDRRPCSRGVTAYRKEGLIRKEGGEWKDKVTERAFSDSYALSGPLGWCWQAMPSTIRHTFEDLCRDVGCLGEATSPVRLRVADEVEPTHLVDEGATSLDPVEPGTVTVGTAEPGRAAALGIAHEAATRRIPSVSQDAHSSSEETRPSVVPSGVASSTTRFRKAGSESVTQPLADTPWPEVLVVPAQSTSTAPVPDEDRLAWCVALHRALVSQIGFGAPPELTGRYFEGVQPPANRIAIQFIPAHHRHPLSDEVRPHTGTAGTFAVMLPPIGDRERATIYSALLALSTVYRADSNARAHGTVPPATRGGKRARGPELRLGDPTLIRADTFWAAPDHDVVRLWRTDPLAIPETSTRRRDSRRRWTFRESAHLSIGLVWRDRFAADLQGAHRFERIAASVADQHPGGRVIEAAAVPRSDVSLWVHKTAEHVATIPYRATLDLRALSDDRAIVAIGQSRHLGGGLLVPRDVPEQMLRERERC
ncbi:type I-U CRISPR-associated protein Csb2 [Nocardia sp. BMG51109]|uniref:type I-G CRISPR-associated protein Csb2 n=1 Tax=Nocardia sp. BMG51109 TaxID=1056816 RepID=UPI000465DDE3|nr:type I-U CRISPR-associated protein Csb2 [Nocardia sp. BMG51109]